MTGCCPAEENREQVESDRSQDDLAGKNEFETGNQTRSGHSLLDRDDMVTADESDENKAKQGHSGIDGINRRRTACEGDKSAASGWTGHR